MSVYVVNIQLNPSSELEDAIEEHYENSEEPCPASVMYPHTEQMINDFIECFNIRVGEPESVYIRITTEEAVQVSKLGNYVSNSVLPFDDDLKCILHIVMPDEISMAYDYDLLKVSECFGDGGFTVIGPTDHDCYAKQSYDSGEFDTGFESSEAGLDFYGDEYIDEHYPLLNIQSMDDLNRLIID